MNNATNDAENAMENAEESKSGEVCDGLSERLQEVELSHAAKESLEKQNSRLVSEFKANKLELDAKKNWDLFYKRNEVNFFKDRHWTTREFQELIDDGGGGGAGEDDDENGGKGRQRQRRVLLEVGCGVGNFVFPLLEDNLDLFIYCCDFSPRGVNFVRQNPKYSEDKIKAFECDITTETLLQELSEESVDIVSMVFVLSAIHPDKHQQVLHNLYSVLKPGGILLFRDYALHDMTMIRFGPGSKISERLYTRQDGTRSFFFIEQDLVDLGSGAGFRLLENGVVRRRTVNKKEGVDAARLFLQTKLVKPAADEASRNNDAEDVS